LERAGTLRLTVDLDDGEILTSDVVVVTPVDFAGGYVVESAAFSAKKRAAPSVSVTGHHFG
jgi:hypothetical protein